MRGPVTAPDRVRTVAALRVAAGVLLIAPRGAGRRGTSTQSAAPRRVAWLLGSRQVVQGVATFCRPEQPTPTVGVAVDVAHAVSMVGLAAVDRKQAHWALRSARAATVWAVTGAAAARPMS